jgi:hypothetical protein
MPERNRIQTQLKRLLALCDFLKDNAGFHTCKQIQSQCNHYSDLHVRTIQRDVNVLVSLSLVRTQKKGLEAQQVCWVGRDPNGKNDTSTFRPASKNKRCKCGALALYLNQFGECLACEARMKSTIKSGIRK